MKDSADQGGCHPQRPKAEVDITLRDLRNSSYPTKAEFNNCFIIHSKYFVLLKVVSPLSSLFFRSPNITQPCPQVFSANSSMICSGLHFWRHFDVIGSIIFGGLHFWRHRFSMGKILSKFGEQQLVMVNHACGFNQSETGKYFEWIIISNYWMRLSRMRRILQIKEGVIHRGGWLTQCTQCWNCLSPIPSALAKFDQIYVDP